MKVIRNNINSKDRNELILYLELFLLIAFDKNIGILIYDKYGIDITDIVKEYVYNSQNGLMEFIIDERIIDMINTIKIDVDNLIRIKKEALELISNIC